MSSQLMRHNLLFKSSSLNLTILSSRFNHRNHPGFKKKPFATPVHLKLPDAYLSEPNYPPVKPKYPPGEWLDNACTKKAWHYYDEGQKFHALKTIQERLSVMAYLNVQQTLDDVKTRRTRYFPIFKLTSIPPTPQMLPFNRYITKTNIVLQDGVHNESDLSLNATISPDLYEKLKTSVQDIILSNSAERQGELLEKHQIPEHADSYQPEGKLREAKLKAKLSQSDSLLKDILNAVATILSTSELNQHLVGAQYGNNVNIKSYWKRCGYETQKPRGAVSPDPDTIRYQFDDVATFQIKCDKPLKPVRASAANNLIF